MYYLNIVVGMIAILLFYSLLVSIVLELIAGLFNFRGKHLLASVRCMLEDSHLGKQLSTDFKNHPLIQKINYTSNTVLPSYITPQTFSIVIQDILPDYFIGNGESLPLNEKFNLLPNGDFKQVVSLFLKTSDWSFDKAFRLWFEITMERSSGRYKRKTQLRTMILGFILAMLLNVNSISIFNTLSMNKEAKVLLLEQAYQLYAKRSDSLSKAQVYTGLGFDHLHDSLSSKRYLDESERMLQRFVSTVQQNGVGWGTLKFSNLSKSELTFNIVGWLVTALAITIGAPFWFDVLQRFMKLRSSGSRPADLKS